MLLAAAVMQPTRQAAVRGASRGRRVQERLGGEDGGKEEERQFNLARATGSHDGGGHQSHDQGQIAVEKGESSKLSWHRWIQAGRCQLPQEQKQT